MSGVANKTAYSILAALGEDVDESAIPKLPEDEEAQKQREARAEAQRRKAEAKAQLLAAQQNKAKAVPPKLMLPFEIIKRTRMCESWIGSGRCKEGQDCVFAHDVQEMNANRAQVRQYQADQYRKMGYTEYADQLLGKKKIPESSYVGAGGSSSSAAAGGSGEGGRMLTKAGRQTGVLHESFRAGGQYYKTRICRNYMHGRCTYGDACSYAHGEADLRDHLQDPDAVEEELAKWGMLPRGSSRRSEAGPSSSSSSIPPYTQGGTATFSYIDGPAVAAAGGTLQYQQQYQQPYPPAQQAQQQQGAGGGMGAKEMDPAQLSALMEGLDFSDEEEHPAFLCPITHERLRDPVVAADGYTYERAAIEGWISTRDTSPMTNQKLEDKVLIPNLTLQEAMRVVLGEDWQ